MISMLSVNCKIQVESLVGDLHIVLGDQLEVFRILNGYENIDYNFFLQK